MKKIFLLYSIVITQMAIAQVLSAPVYEYMGTTTSSEFSAGSGITPTTDITGVGNGAVNLAANHGPLKLNLTTHKASLMSEGTVSMWFKYSSSGTSAFGSDKPLVFWSNGAGSYSEGIMMGLSGSKLIARSYTSGSVGVGDTSNENFGTAGTWKHFIVTWKMGSGGFLKAYMNGALVINRPLTHSLPSGTLSTMYFTGFNDTFSSAINGAIDEIKVYTQSVTDAQAWSIYSPATPYCVVHIPDANFKYALLNHSPIIDTNANGVIECAEAAAFTGILNLYNKNISNLTGIEAFTNLTKLYCGKNYLTSLDVSANTALKELSFTNNQITNINLNTNTELSILDTSYNLLTSLDVSANTLLTKLYCNNSSLTSLNVNGSTLLSDLFCNNNQLTNLDVSTNSALYRFYCFSNNLASLDTSSNTTLYQLLCNDNQLTSLNIANGNNGFLNYLRSRENPNLTCVQVDNANWSNTNWTGYNYEIPLGASYSQNCSGILSTSDHPKILKMEAYPNPTSGLVNLSEMANVIICDAQGRKILEIKNTNSFDLSAQTAGIYTAQITNEKGIKTVKIIKK
ncbi:LamG-like jellyroll fold domain-containing protein [Chryseobacterium sp. MYb264]|uniref:LamG-like jellyroll fold domain-containing protein n=1 Tax=Chryseobacterium sp. MYb264 TaxID=2745153 RepID=UPI002E10119B|nr:LamG-like jellyroll fold domain-containing protein [Chryseobacterium sp. MYb264]